MALAFSYLHCAMCTHTAIVTVLSWSTFNSLSTPQLPLCPVYVYTNLIAHAQCDEEEKRPNDKVGQY